MSEIVLVRHGQASFGSDDYDRLSTLGKKQSKALGLHLTELRLQPHQVFCGEMQRQRHTAQLALAAMHCDLEPTVDTTFNEYDSDNVFKNFMPEVLNTVPHIREQITREDYSMLRQRHVFEQVFFPVVNKWIAGETAKITPFESWQSFRKRVIRGIRRILQNQADETTTIIFTSGGVIAAAMIDILGLRPELWAGFSWKTPNASITRFATGANGLMLECYNQYGYLCDPTRGVKVTYL